VSIRQRLHAELMREIDRENAEISAKIQERDDILYGKKQTAAESKAELDRFKATHRQEMSAAQAEFSNLNARQRAADDQRFERPSPDFVGPMQPGTTRRELDDSGAQSLRDRIERLRQENDERMQSDLQRLTRQPDAARPVADLATEAATAKLTAGMDTLAGSTGKAGSALDQFGEGARTAIERITEAARGLLQMVASPSGGGPHFLAGIDG
jgi:hypothetical protein